MQVIQINAGTFKCDGGGIFGSVPKVLWSRHIVADHNNMITIPMRCLLIVSEERKLLIETGAGNKHDEKFIRNNGLDNVNKLRASLNQAGFDLEDITDVLHTHLHWDHCGGSTFIDKNGNIVPTFPNAKYHVSKEQWENALAPNRREADAYFVDDFIPIKESGLLNIIDTETTHIPGVQLKFYNGHTPGQIIPFILFRGKTLVYVSDLIPTVANIPIKWIASYDLYPVTSMDEKESFMQEAAKNAYVLFFEHDPRFECAAVTWDEAKGSKLLGTGTLTEMF